MTSFCLSVLVGLSMVRWTALHGLICVGILALLVCLLAAWRRQLQLGLVGVVLAGLVIGLMRGQDFRQRQLQYQKLLGKPIVLRAQVDGDAIYGQHATLDFSVSRARVLPAGPALSGSIKVTGLGENMIYKGDVITASGQLSRTRGSARAKMSFAKVQLVSRHPSAIDNLRRRFVAGLQSVLPEPMASFGAGLLIGQRSTIPQAVNDQLSAAGLTHLVAVSGYNLTIIIVAVRRLLGRLSKFQSTVVSAGLVLAFVLLTGFSASIVRAALVSGLSLLAWYYGRTFKPLLLISLAAAITAYWDPFYLWSDIGWYLSFLAFFGVLLLAPLLVEQVGRIVKPRGMILLLCETLSAQLLTLPIIMYIFGRLSLVGLLANLLVVPLVPLAMLLSLLAGLVGVLLPSAAGWLAWPAQWLLAYMLGVVGLCAGLPHAVVERSISAADMVICYGLIVSLVIWLACRGSPQYVTITE